MHEWVGRTSDIAYNAGIWKMSGLWVSGDPVSSRIRWKSWPRRRMIMSATDLTLDLTPENKINT
ncbi:MAG: hypothetical protein VB065_14450, partial [Eubacteriales bacterium]|nr:hypothetical protein [Eubacteriales bacterium]